MAGKINKDLIIKKISQSGALKREVEKLAKKELDVKTDLFIESFTSHLVSQEIEEGVDANNISGTLGGYGNLFSFIGFKNGDKPIEDLVKFFRKNIKVAHNTVKFETKGNKIIAKVGVKVPAKQEIIEETPFEWDTGSWLFGIEKGISGLSYYINRILLGRSGGGAQTKKPIRSGGFKPTSYFSSLYNKFLKSLSSKNKFD